MEGLSSVWAGPGRKPSLLAHDGFGEGNNNGRHIDHPIGKWVPNAPINAAEYLFVVATVDIKTDGKLDKTNRDKKAAKI
ncbi:MULTISPECIES: hypothetical protein [Halomonas]|uniref:hypothetical protein n=1 Tax=Halomonas TaxID=2745 RepID=UPI0018672AA6|nr:MULTISPECIES: hypothetical protein [Halomonas]